MVIMERVVRNSLDQAFKRLTRRLRADGLTAEARKRSARLRPGEAARVARQTSARKRAHRELMDNLAVIFARRSRGF
ncbi:hypothetical protein MMPV_004319 [Pyropia vietnamensis]